MVVQTIQAVIGIPTNQIENWMQQSPRDVSKDATYIQLIETVDVEQLRSTMSITRKYLDGKLPTIVNLYKEKYQMAEFPLTGFMLCNWVLGYLESPANLGQLIDRHTNVSTKIMKAALPDIFAVLANAPQNPTKWQKAFAILVIPLLADGS